MPFQGINVCDTQARLWTKDFIKHTSPIDGSATLWINNNNNNNNNAPKNERQRRSLIFCFSL